MNNQNLKQNLVKLTAIVVLTLPTVLLQAQTSQAIPLDGILDSAGKAFVRALFNLPPEPPEAPKEVITTEVIATPDNSNVTDPGSISTDTTDIVIQN
ncbi:hypothetical protein [Chamaesiphon sp. VAR_69_metabat_338]|uniref:hypothetical protein n=1 Tax=Chamaesiphon sp. VAR_69_metabat_338 TaxID=2964704 RepID=UPI00286D7DB7|nr:hypothetical protein [Chamaesiphon sp. VAR_69_metabat_338]